MTEEKVVGEWLMGSRSVEGVLVDQGLYCLW